MVGSWKGSDFTMFQVKTGSKMCMNASCGSTSTVEWKKGWPLRSGALADLCFRCGCVLISLIGLKVSIFLFLLWCVCV